MCLSVSFFKILVQSKIVNSYCNFWLSFRGLIPPEWLFSDEALRQLPGETSNKKKKKNVKNNIFVIFTGRASE